METAFFEPDGDAFRATELSRGPWDDGLQHFGPPAALVGGAVEAVACDVPQRVARITFEILRPVPITPLRVDVEVVRPGRRVMLVEADLTDTSGRLYARARAWRLRTTELDLPEQVRRAGGAGPGLPPPDQASRKQFFIPDEVTGYHTATDWRFVEGAFLQPGPATAWCRTRVPVVAGREVSPLQRVLLAADSGNGISAVAAPDELLFVNTELTVALHRDPVGEWVGLDARTIVEPNGTGLATSRLHDESGPIGQASQTLFIDFHGPAA